MNTVTSPKNRSGNTVPPPRPAPEQVVPVPAPEKPATNGAGEGILVTTYDRQGKPFQYTAV